MAIAQPLYDNEKHGSNLLHDLNRERYGADSFCDATLQVGDVDFRVHKCVVAKFSSFFRNLFTNEIKEKYDSFANINEVNSKVMETVLNFIYTGSRDRINEKNVFDLLTVSEHLQVEGLLACCSDFMMNNISTKNFVKFYLTAKRHKMIVLKRKAEEMLAKNFEAAIKQEEFLSLERGDLMYFLSWAEQDSSVFAVRDVLRGIMAWVRHDTGQRDIFLCEMLKLVKLKYLPLQFLREVIRDNLLETSSIVRSEIDLKSHCLRVRGEHDASSFAIADSSGSINIFNVLSETWRKLLSSFNEPAACFAAYQDYLYVFGGQTPAIQRLDLSKEDRASLETVGRFYSESKSLSAAAYNGIIVIFTGIQDNFRFYNVSTSEVTPMEPPPAQRVNPSMVVCNGSLYCFGGSQVTPTERYCDRYWKVADDQRRFSSCVAVAAIDEIYVFDHNQYVEAFNVQNKQWRKPSQCPVRYIRYNALFMQGRIFTFGTVSVREYVLMEHVIAHNTWRKVCSLPCKHAPFSITPV